MDIVRNNFDNILEYYYLSLTQDVFCLKFWIKTVFQTKYVVFFLQKCIKFDLYTYNIYLFFEFSNFALDWTEVKY